MLLLLALLLLCNEVGNAHCSTIHENSVDLHSLLAFKQSITNDPQGALSNWDNRTHFCRWNGVNCTSTTPPFRVSSLILASQNLAGQISPSLGNLTFLTWLDLSGNYFVGPLPVLGHLQRLQTLYLNNNSLNGIIPDSLTNCSNFINLDISVNSLVGVIPTKLVFLSSLAYLDLSANSLAVGQIPLKLDFLPKLIYLDLSVNLLVGQIPPSLGFLPNLTYIFLRSNQLKGSIPELGQFPQLQELILGKNKLSCELPHAILNASGSLQILGLEFNMLSNTLPPNIGDRLPKLIHLTLSGNTFEGNIPASLGNAQGLKLIDLSDNSFTWIIPTSFGKLSNLTILNLENNLLETRDNRDWEFLNALRNNSFTGIIPTSFGKLSNLTTLNLENNLLETRDNRDWEFLNALRNCRSLKVLSVSLNQLQGSTPQSIGNLSPSLEQLLLFGNNLSGQVPQSIRKLSALIKLSNSFTGLIPSSVGKLTRLTYLHIGENEFEGHIPASLGNLPLLRLHLGDNNFQVYIPSKFGNLQQLISLNLSHNYLQGDIPHISTLKQLTTLDLSSNKLTGQIPDSLGQCNGLVSLQIDQNFMSGNIPTTFGNLLSPSMLNISHNNLSGTIPLALSKLEYLINLDLSCNNLEGELPRNGVFGNATAVSIEGNWGLFGGAIDLHMPMCPTVSRRSETQYYLVRALIPLFGFTSLVMLAYIVFFGKKTSRTTYSVLLSSGKKFPRVAYNDVARATGKFSELNLIGRGSYGSVYRGKLTQAKIQVAIKVFDLDMKCADKSFVIEYEVLSRIRHRNLVPILTACSTVHNKGDTFKALIYEFMPNGNLDTWLHNKFLSSSSKYLSLSQRAIIATGIANALAYLHNDCERQIVHCDLKPKNILLDDDMNAYFGDFGIASLIGHSSLATSTGLKGTIGHIAPGIYIAVPALSF
ncbi:hypothetical protein CFC21_039291 [Triticum aestivum]|uniref:Protein kinase domain-containing protein n=3 Tax=Triticum TaxID=4564 RepID=A0A9R1FEI9_WHEAT|nr:hypothetical protein CFC21_039291 [Triticum aestivum]CDM80698.1 unnamed protein product [Triticum aestivum]VAH71532.1 unnamed protein product [Triticum turgidum subsp. durum]